MAKPNLRRVRWIGAAAFSVAVVAMAIDHLIGTEGDEESGLADPATFGVSVALCGLLAVVLFAWLAPRAISRGPSRAATTGLICAVLSVVPGIALLWLGLPFVSAGAAVALGMEGSRDRRWQGAAATAIGLMVVVLGLSLYAYALMTR